MPISKHFFHFPQEAQTGFEPVNQGVADLCLTTWLLRHVIGTLVYYNKCPPISQ